MARNQRLRQRGIFGILKPDEPMLFSFLPNGAQEWPSDDDDLDSDYDPDHPDERDETEGQTAAANDAKPKSKRSRQKTGSSKRKTGTTRQSREETHSERPKGVKRTKRQRTDTSKSSLKTKRLQKRTDPSHTRSSAGTDDIGNTSDGPPSASEGQGPISEGHHLWGQRFPLVALQNVFQYVVETDGAVPFLCRACMVCRLWREAATHSSLWQHIDLANGRIKCTDSTLEWLAEHRLSRLKSINLGGWKKMTDVGLKALVKHCSQQLASASLSGCIKITAESFCSLVDSCPHLHTLDLSQSNADVVSVTSMTHVLQALGNRLLSLNLASNKLKGAPAILKTLMIHCGQILALDISNCKFTSDFLMLHIEELQRGCPRLEVLRLAGCMVRASQVASKVQAASTGFPELQELSLAINNDNIANGGIAVDDSMLLRLLVRSHKLKLLDLRGCTHISAAVIQSLPVYDLQHLFISQSSVSRYEGIEAIVQKWKHSLIELDLSWNVFPAMSLDIAMKKLSSVPGQSVLRDINLAGTSITAERVRSGSRSVIQPLVRSIQQAVSGVGTNARITDRDLDPYETNRPLVTRSILEGCPSLVSLNLASCRGLPRGMKRSYHGNCLAQLKSDLKAAPASSLEYVE